MEKHHRLSIWHVLIAVWIVLIPQNWIVHMFAVERVSYSEFVKPPRPEGRGFCLAVVLRARGASRSRPSKPEGWWWLSHKIASRAR